MGHASPKYTAEFKQRAVQLYRERGGAYAEIGREPGVDPGSVSDWVKRADAAGSDPSVFVNKEIDISLCRFSTLRWQAPTHLPS